MIKGLQSGGFLMREIHTAKQKVGLTAFLTLNALETKIFQYCFPQGHKGNVWENNGPWLSTQRDIVANIQNYMSSADTVCFIRLHNPTQFPAQSMFFPHTVWCQNSTLFFSAP